jgi:hypothetical protein
MEQPTTVNFVLSEPTVSITTDTVITLPDMIIDLPKDALTITSTNTAISVSMVNSTELNQYILPYSKELKAMNSAKKIEFGNGQKILNKNMKIVMGYTDSEIASLSLAMAHTDKSATTVNENNLKMFWWNEDNKVWVLVENSAVNATSNTVTGYFNKAGIYRLMEYNASAVAPAGKKIYSLSNYPNPFKASSGKKTRIRYYLASSSDVKIRIFDLFGQLTWENNISKGDLGSFAGPNEIEWDGKNKEGILVDSNLYICHIQVGDDKEVTKIGVE